jgi:hypothetical protein
LRWNEKHYFWKVDLLLFSFAFKVKSVRLSFKKKMLSLKNASVYFYANVMSWLITQVKIVRFSLKKKKCCH